MLYITLLAAATFIAAAAADRCPGGKRASRRLLAAACVMAAAAAMAPAVVREGMFRDLAAVPAGLWLRAALSLGLSVAFAALSARAVSKKR